MATTRQVKFLNSVHHALGTPYVWGGSAPGGFDCSGLVYWAARAAGIKGVPRTSEEQYKVGKPVSMSNLLPGDLVFAYPEAGGPGHVVVYIGHGRVIAAPHTGTDVQIENLSDFKGLIVGARRILANPQGGVYKAGQFVGGGGSMPGDAANGGARQGAGQGQAPQFHAPVITPLQFGNPAQSAQQTLQSVLKPQTALNGQPSPLQSAQPLAQLQALKPVAQPFGDQLGALHDNLLKLGAQP